MSESFDLAKTQIVADLLAAPTDQRDMAWIRRLYDAAPDASMTAGDPQMRQGPDGYPYFWLHVPPVGEPFTAFSMNHVREVCTDNGWGCVLVGREETAPWVFTYGNMWSLRALGALDTTPPDAVRRLPPPDGQLLVGAPSEDAVPGWARRVLRSWFEHHGVPDVEAALVVDSGGYGEAGAAEWLAFSVFPEQFGDPDDYQAFMRQVEWFLPPRFALLGAPRGAFQLTRL